MFRKINTQTCKTKLVFDWLPNYFIIKKMKEEYADGNIHIRII